MPTAAARPLPCTRDARLGRALPAAPAAPAWGSLTTSSCARMRWYMRSRSWTGRMGSYAPCSFCREKADDQQSLNDVIQDASLKTAVRGAATLAPEVMHILKVQASHQVLAGYELKSKGDVKIIFG